MIACIVTDRTRGVTFHVSSAEFTDIPYSLCFGWTLDGLHARAKIQASVQMGMSAYEPTSVSAYRISYDLRLTYRRNRLQIVLSGRRAFGVL